MAELRAKVYEVETQVTLSFGGGLEAAQAQVKVIVPSDLSLMDMFKVVIDGQIVQEVVGDAAKPVADEAGNKDSSNTVANEGVPESEAPPATTSEVVEDI